jgi:hypothetical protein
MEKDFVIQEAIQRIEAAVKRFKPNKIFALFSGGHDSLTASYVAAQHGVDAVVHINTGIGIPATRQFAEETCVEHNWKFLEYKAVQNINAKGEFDPQIYEQMVLEHGFPGPFMHRKMYSRLKERQVELLQRQHKRILLISGCRSEESLRRMGHTEEFHSQGNRAWCAPIWDWNKVQCSGCLGAKFRRNETALRYGRSGECLCGAFSKPGELTALQFACPASYQRLRDLEKKVRAAGFPWGWEDPGPPKWFQEKQQGQTFMLGYDEDENVEEDLCTSCKWRAL